jgi:hypothetical protein
MRTARTSRVGLSNLTARLSGERALEGEPATAARNPRDVARVSDFEQARRGYRLLTRAAAESVDPRLNEANFTLRTALWGENSESG